jgi:protein-S-isoprenylcysteine O-methyltransferase Ste14
LQALKVALKKYNPLSRKKLRSLLVLCGLLLFALGLTRWKWGFSAAGAAVLFVGMMLHLWSKGHLQQNRVLTLTGPYRWVRNPFYLANGLIDIGICLIIHRPDVLAIYFAFWAFAYRRKIKREEETLESLFGEQFRRYKAQVPCLIPYKVPSSRSESDDGRARFSWRNHNIAAGREIPRLLRIGSIPLLFLLVSKLHSEGLRFLNPLTGPGLLLPGLLLTVYLAARVLGATLKQKRSPLPALADAKALGKNSLP